MPAKRTILAQLSADELRGNVDRYELPVADRRVKAQLADALARTRKARVEEMLLDLFCGRLKELCRALLGTWAICKMNMLLHGLPDARTEKGDTIRAPELFDEGELLLYDRVNADLPFSLDGFGKSGRCGATIAVSDLRQEQQGC